MDAHSKLAKNATRWEFGKVERGEAEFRIEIRSNNPNLYCIIHKSNMIWNETELAWIYEAMPSNRTDKFRKETRYTLDAADRYMQKLLEVNK